jgi:hypothetical protein
MIVLPSQGEGTRIRNHCHERAPVNVLLGSALQVPKAEFHRPTRSYRAISAALKSLFVLQCDRRSFFPIVTIPANPRSSLNDGR